MTEVAGNEMASGDSASLGDLAALTGGRVVGSDAARIHQVAAIDTATPGTITFLANRRYRGWLDHTQASAVIVAEGDLPANDEMRSYLVSDRPYLAFARIARYLNPGVAAEPEMAASAVIAGDARIGEGITIGPGAVIGPGAHIGDHVSIGANTVIGEGVTVGDRTRFEALINVYRGCVIGSDAIIHSGSVIGADGFGFAASEDGSWEKVPQLGGVRIGNYVEIGANCCVDRGALGETIIEDGVKLDNFVQIGHNVRLGADSIMASKSGIAGSTDVGAGCQIAAGVGVGGHLTIASGSVMTAMSMINHDIPEAGMYSSGIPMSPTREWRRNALRFNELDKTVRRVRSLERRVDQALDNDKGNT